MPKRTPSIEKGYDHLYQKIEQGRKTQSRSRYKEQAFSQNAATAIRFSLDGLQCIKRKRALRV